MRQLTLLVSAQILVLGLLFASSVSSAADAGKDSPADTLKLRNIEVTFHQAGSALPKPDLDLMMSLYTDDAVLVDTAHDNKTYSGKAEVRRYFSEIAAPFKPGNHWVGYTPAMRIKTAVQGDTATLYFECLWMDADKNAIGVHSFSDMTLVRSGDAWLVKTIKVGKVDKL